MAKGAYLGVSSKAKKVKKIYIGQNGIAKRVKKAYIGVNGKAQLFYNAGGKFFYAMGTSYYNNGEYNTETNNLTSAYTWQQASLVDNAVCLQMAYYRVSPIMFYSNSWVWVSKQDSAEPIVVLMDKDSLSVTRLTISDYTNTASFAYSRVHGFVVDSGHAYLLIVTNSGTKGYFIDVNLSNLSYTVTYTNRNNFYNQSMTAEKINQLCILPNGKLLMYVDTSGYLYVYDKSNNTLTQMSTSIGSSWAGFFNRAKNTNVVCINVNGRVATTNGSTITVSTQSAPSYGHDCVIWCNNEFLLIYNIYLSTSSDGNTWTALTTQTAPTTSIRAFGYGDGMYLGYGMKSDGSAYFCKSTDKINWTALTAPLWSGSLNDYLNANITFSDVGINNGVGT